VEAALTRLRLPFAAARFAIWPKVREFIEAIPAGALVADVGCGNGKYFGVRRDLAVLGSDRSAGLAQVAAQRLHPAGLPTLQIPKADVLVGWLGWLVLALHTGAPMLGLLLGPLTAVQPGHAARAQDATRGTSTIQRPLHATPAQVADGLSLPYRPGSFDAVLCIAVLHHLSSEARRAKLLAQLAALLRPGGRALVTVWATEQEEPKRTIDKWQRIAKPAEALAGGRECGLRAGQAAA
jgi:SAM-dependent methyltransferase